MKAAKSALFGLLASTAFVPVAVYAQDATRSDSRSTDVGEIVVTAQKREQSANSVGMSINAASGDQLKAMGVKDVADLAKIVPSLTVQPTVFGSPVYTIRGIGFYESSLQASPAVTVYTDEVPLPYPAMTRFAGLDLERVEVLKGPQGTLYGQNSTGGAINYISAKPTEEFRAGADLEYGRFNTIEGQAFISGPISSNLFFRLAARHTNADDWQYSYTRKDTAGQRDETQGRLTLEWKPTDRFSLRVLASGWKDRSDTLAPQLAAITLQNPAFIANPSLDPFHIASTPLNPRNARAANWTIGRSLKRDDSFYQFSARADYGLTDAITVTSVTAYAKLKAIDPTDGDALDVDSSDPTNMGSIKAFSQELRLAGDTEQMNWVVGVNYTRDTIHDRWLNDIVAATSATVFGIQLGRSDQRADSENKSYGVFGNLEYKLTDQLALQGGVRYTSDKRAFRGCTAAIGGVGPVFQILSTAFTGKPQPLLPVGSCVTLDNKTFLQGEVRDNLDRHYVSWRGGVNYEFADRSLVYVNVSRGYKAGSFPTLAYSDSSQAAPVEPEKVTAYEVGIKGRLLSGMLQVNAAAFYYDYINKQARGKFNIFPWGTLEGLVNIPKSDVKGAEFELTAQPVQGLRLHFGATYIETKVKKFIGISDDGVPNTNFAGETFAYTPKFSFVSDAEYRFPVSNNLNMIMGVGVTGQSKTHGGIGGQKPYLEMPSYVLVDARLGIAAQDERWSVTLFGHNITNKYYLINATRFNDTAVRYAGRPVTYGVRFTYRTD